MSATWGKSMMLALLFAAVVPINAHAQPVASCAHEGRPGFPTNMEYLFRQNANGKRILFVAGGISAGESQRLANAIKANRPIDEVWLHSPGGSAIEGFKMGRVLRRAGLATRIPQQFSCMSACASAFLGGAVRLVDPGGQYGVHMFSAAGATARVDELATRMQGGRDAARRVYREMEQTSAVFAAEQSKYIVEMGVSLRLNDLMVLTEAQDMRCLTQDELHRLNVVNLIE
jgi:hypothetical protein